MKWSRLFVAIRSQEHIGTLAYGRKRAIPNWAIYGRFWLRPLWQRVLASSPLALLRIPWQVQVTGGGLAAGFYRAVSCQHAGAGQARAQRRLNTYYNTTHGQAHQLPSRRCEPFIREPASVRTSPPVDRGLRRNQLPAPAPPGERKTPESTCWLTRQLEPRRRQRQPARRPSRYHRWPVVRRSDLKAGTALTRKRQRRRSG